MPQPKAPDVGIVAQPTPLGPDTSTAQLISGLGKQAGQQVKAVQQARLTGEVTNTAEAAKTVNDITHQLESTGASQSDIQTTLQKAISFDPSNDPNATLDGLQLPDSLKQKLATVKKNAGEAFNNIAAAVSQGALSENAAALQIEAQTRRLVNETPGFGPEIKQLARELTGYDPTNYDLQQVLNISKPKTPLTAYDKMSQQADAIVQGLHNAGREVDKNTVMGNLALSQYNDAKSQALQAQLKMNDISFQSYVHQTVADRGPDLSKTLLGIATMTKKQGGIAQPQDYLNIVTQQQEAEKNELRRVAAQYGQGVSDAQLQTGLDQVDKAYAPIIQAVKDNGLGTLLDTQLKTVAKLNQLWGIQTLPRLTQLVQAFPGSKIPDQLIQMMANVADPKQFALLESFDPGIKALVDQGLETPSSVSSKLFDVTNKILTGQELSSGDLKFEPLAERVVISSPNTSDTRQKFIDGLAVNAPVRATSLLATSVPRVKATQKEVQFMKRQYKVYVGRPDGSPEPTLVDQVAKDIPAYALDTLQVQMQKKTVTTGVDASGHPITATKEVPVIFFDDRPAPVRTKGPYVNLAIPDSLKKLQVFVNAVTNGYGKDFGVDQASFAQNLVNRIKAQMEVVDHLNFSGKVQRGKQ